MSNPSSTPVESARKPLITALICTANRGDSIVPTVTSILRPGSATGELLIIDQSTDDRTEAALQPFLSDPRLRYIRTTTKGKGIALNMGLQEARGEFVAITDDDCEVSEQWPACHLQIFLKYPHVAVTYGNVFAVKHDMDKGFIPVYEVGHDRLCQTIWQKLTARGIGANMAVRREVALELGGFDPELGPGGRFRACVDGDITARALLAGYHVYETANSEVYHYGFRTWEQGRTLTNNAFYGIGAAYSKPLKCGRWRFAIVPAYEFLLFAVWPPLRDLLHLKRPRGLARIPSFLRGVVEGWRTPVDRATLRFRQQ